MIKGKKGLTSGLFVILIFMFLFGLFSLFSAKMWNEYNDNIQAAPNSTISQDVKDDINDLGVFFSWGDYLFVIFFVALLVSYLISAVTIPTRQTIFFLIFVVFVVLVTVLAMVFSNSWEFILSGDVFTAEIESFKFTTFFMKYFPFFTAGIGLFGGVLFFARKFIFQRETDEGGVMIGR